MISGWKTRARQVIDLVRTARASLQAMHPESQDVDLGRYFTIDVGDTEAPALQDSLLQSKGVTAAYIQPAEELP